MRIKFTNHSVSGVHRQYPAFALEIPGSDAVTLDVPDELVEDVKAHLATHQPAIAIEENPAEEAASEGLDDEAEAERLAAEAEAAAAAAVEAEELAAEAAEKVSKGKGGSRK